MDLVLVYHRIFNLSTVSMLYTSHTWDSTIFNFVNNFGQFYAIINTLICLRQIVHETINVGGETAAALKAQVSSE